MILLPRIVPVLSLSTVAKGASSFKRTAPDANNNNNIQHQHRNATTNNANNHPQLRVLAAKSINKAPSSLRYLRAWRLWSETVIKILRTELAENNLPTPIDRDALQELTVQLGLAAEGGSMPSFKDEGARAGYAVDYFCRAQMAADLLFSSREPDFLVEAIQDMFGGRTIGNTAASSRTAKSLSSDTNKICRMTSLGGGPGFDFVAAALIATFNSQQTSYHDERMSPPTTIHANVFDYETGWQPLVEAMATSIDTVLCTPPEGKTSQPWSQHTCQFGACDITVPLSDPANAQLSRDDHKVLRETDLWICAYCVAENASKLRQGDFVFFRELFENAKVGSLFLFTETTHRLWPELANVALNIHNDDDGTAAVEFHIAFPRRSGGKGKLGPQMVVQKRFVRAGSTVRRTLGEKELAQCKIFERDNTMQERKIQNGKRRIIRKAPGAK